MKIDSSPGQWDALRPFFVDNSGRNDIVETKVTYDSQNVYLYVKTYANISTATGTNWMNLLISTNFATTKTTAYLKDGVGLSDPNAQPSFDFLTAPTGFKNYQFIINQSRNTTAKTASIERFDSNTFTDKTKIGDVKYEVINKEMQICIPRSLLGLDGNKVEFSFKWADNVTDMTDIQSYYKTGDCAPIGSMNYHFNSQE